jgi:hypothetical protein
MYHARKVEKSIIPYMEYRGISYMEYSTAKFLEIVLVGIPWNLMQIPTKVRNYRS